MGGVGRGGEGGGESTGVDRDRSRERGRLDELGNNQYAGAGNQKSTDQYVIKRAVHSRQVP